MRTNTTNINGFATLRSIALLILFQGTNNWYRRHENNGWRPITIKTLSSAEHDPVTAETAKASAARSGDGADGSPAGGGGFHYSRLVREECRVARIKRRVR